MPKITKQTMKKVPRKKVKTGGILESAIDVADLDEGYLRVLIYGPNRAGKTYLACCFDKPLILASFEPSKSGGASSIKDFKGVKFLQLGSSEDVFTLAEELKQPNPYKTLVADSATSLQDVVLKELLGLDELPVSLSFGTVSTDQYRARAEKTRELLRKFLDLPMDVVVTAKERDHNPPARGDDGKLDFRPKMVKPLQLESFVAADVGGATAGFLNDSCDYIFRLYKDEEMVARKITLKGKEKVSYVPSGRYVRHLLVDYHPNYAGGCRLGGNRIKVPESGIMVNPSHEEIMKLIRGRD